MISRMRYTQDMNAKAPNDLSAQLKAAIGDSGLSMLKVAERSGLRYQTVHGFITADRDIALSSATKLAALFRLELRPARRGRRK